jgi:hypothetical protein
MDKDLLGSAKKNRIAAKRISVNKRRDEGAYLNWYVTEEQRGCRPIFIATLRAARLLAGCFVAYPAKDAAAPLYQPRTWCPRCWLAPGSIPETSSGGNNS